MATTRSRPRGREHARPSSGGVAAEHATKIWTVAIIGIVVIVAVLTLTSIGHTIDLATQHFMLFYAGVFALIALCASVGLGLVATDRMFLNPGHRVLVQAAHRAASFGAVTFLIVHIVTEILAQRVHVLDAVVPFLSPFRTFYIGIGTVASDLLIVLVITGILRGRYTAHGKAWRWRAIHYTSYASFVLGVWHSLLAGRAGKPYVDWSYGFVVAFVAVGLAVRILSNSLRPKENLSGPPVPTSENTATAPLRAAATFAKLGSLGMGRPGGAGGSAGSGRLVVPSTAQPVLSAPVADYDTQPPMLTASASAGAAERQPYYEPGYEGPPRYLGAPTAGTGPLPNTATGPIPRAATGPIPRPATGPLPRAGGGPAPRAATAPVPSSTPSLRPQSMTGPIPATGPRPMTGPIPAAGARPMTGPIPAAGARPMTGPIPATGPRPMTGPIPAAGPGPMTGPMPRAPRGPMARPAAGPTLPPGVAGPQGGRVNGGGQPRDPRGGGMYQEQPQPPWDGGLPGSDPALMYREPGPGMPGYRGSREHRYGGDQR